MTYSIALQVAVKDYLPIDVPFLSLEPITGINCQYLKKILGSSRESWYVTFSAHDCKQKRFTTLWPASAAAHTLAEP